MTKKHFIRMADKVREILPHMTPEDAETVITALCKFCREQNPRFNETTFRGYIAGTCGPCGGQLPKEPEGGAPDLEEPSNGGLLYP